MTLKHLGVRVEFNLDRADDLVLPPLNFRSLKQYGKQLETFTLGKADLESIDLVAVLAFESAKRNYPDITKEKLEDLIDVGNMTQIMDALMDVSNLKAKEQRKEDAAAQADPSSGTNSMLS